MSRTSQIVDRTFCHRLPKVELHAHINGSISPATMERLTRIKMATSSDLQSTFDAIEKWRSSVASGERRNLNECFETFKLIHTVVSDAESVAMVTYDVIKEFAYDGVKYIELRSTPRDNPENHMTKRTYIEAVMKGIRQCEEEGIDIIVKFLPSIDRRMSLSSASEVVDLALEYFLSPDSKVVGLDLSGDPNKGDVNELLPLLHRARNHGLKLAVHLAERCDQNEENKILLGIPPDRIGHGTYLHPEVGGKQEFVDTVERLKIPLELCFTSNLIGRTVSRPEEHHLVYWYQKKHPSLICTDDKGVFSTNLSQEYLLAANTFQLTSDDLWALSEGSIDCIFGGDDVKLVLQRRWRDYKIRLGL